MTVIEAYPESEQADVYRDLARRLLLPPVLYKPLPLENIEEIINLIGFNQANFVI